MSITPQFSNSKLIIEFNSGMAYGAGTPLIVRALRSINGGAYKALSNGSRDYDLGYYANSWGPFAVKTMDSPNTTQPIVYKLQIKSGSPGVTANLTHPRMGYMWTVTELKQ